MEVYYVDEVDYDPIVTFSEGEAERAAMLEFFAKQKQSDRWEIVAHSDLRVGALPAKSNDEQMEQLMLIDDDVETSISGSVSARKKFRFAADSIKDSPLGACYGLAVDIGSGFYPLRSTAWKSLQERAKVGGTSLSKLDPAYLAYHISRCIWLYTKSTAKVLVRGGKISALHSGGDGDYEILPVIDLLTVLNNYLNDRFPGNKYRNGYYDNTIASASWSLEGQSKSLIGTYVTHLKAHGIPGGDIDSIVPAICFSSSDVGTSSAKVSAMLKTSRGNIRIGSCVSTNHRNHATVEDFAKSLDGLFTSFSDLMSKLDRLLNIYLDYPVDAMRHVCKKLSLPRKEAALAITDYEALVGGGIGTAHEVFMAMQEILFHMRANKVKEAKCMSIEEDLTRALLLDWKSYDRPYQL